MMRVFRPLILLLLVPCYAAAHHAFAAEFAVNSPVTLTGTVVKVEWLNPHARFVLDVSSRGSSARWEMVLGSPNFLIRLGWERSYLKVGDVVTVTGFRARDGAHLAAVRTIHLASGRIAAFGAAGDGGPER